MDIVPEITRRSIVNLVSNDKREDGRALDEYRDISIETNVISKAEGSARVKLGGTQVIVGIKPQLGSPFPDTPDLGVLMTNCEMLPMADPTFEPGPPSDDSIELVPRKGEYYVLDKSVGNLAVHTIFQCPNEMGKGILVSPTVDGNLLLGPTAVDGEDKTDKSICPDFFSSIYSVAERSVYGIPKNKTITSFCGLRAVGSTGDFIIKSRGHVCRQLVELVEYPLIFK